VGDLNRGYGSLRTNESGYALLAMNRLEARGKGILLLHDIHPATVAALPGLLKELKQRGFHIVHVVPTSVDQLSSA
jgi:peptidoglycan/xylan/chitin deacetylase (PgdA/CDA1 family)